MNDHDRCDSCGVPALVRVEKMGKILFFCGHHYQDNRAALAAQGFIASEELTPA